MFLQPSLRGLIMKKTGMLLIASAMLLGLNGCYYYGPPHPAVIAPAPSVVVPAPSIVVPVVPRYPHRRHYHYDSRYYNRHHYRPYR